MNLNEAIMWVVSRGLALSAQVHPESAAIIAFIGLVAACVGLALGYVVGRIIRVVRHR